MATAILGLKNDHAAGDPLSATDWVNPVADATEWGLGATASVSVTTADVTLSAAQYQVRVIQVSGALTGNRNLILPANAGWGWWIYNAGSGAFTLTAKTAAGTGVVVPQGGTSYVWCDGTNIRAGHLALISPRIGTSILDANGNELAKLTATTSAVNELTISNAATGGGPVIEATGDDANIDVTLRGKGTGGVQVSRSGGKLAFFGVTLQARAAALTQSYATAERTLSAYTADNEGTPYTGIDNAQAGTVYATVADLNALRAAVENLRGFTEDLAQFLNAVVDDLQAYGLEQ